MSFFFLIGFFCLALLFFFSSIDPHKYNICLFPCSPQKKSTDTGIYKPSGGMGGDELNGSSMSNKIIRIKKTNMMKSL